MDKFVQQSGKPNLLPHEPASGKGWREKLVRLGRWRALLLVSVCAVTASVLIALPLSLLFGAQTTDLPYVLLTSLLVSMFVAPAVAHFLMQLLFELEQTRAQLLNMATRDSLTQVYNRRFFMESLEIQAARASRTNTNLAVLMIDIDDFKLVNDQFGHSTGDRVLQKIAQVCTDILRSYDILARLGGEEFVVMLPNLTLKEACEVAERLRIVTAGLRIQTDLGTLINVTISLGVSVLTPNTPNNQSLLNQADKALYKAKRAGKNRWAS